MVGPGVPPSRSGGEQSPTASEGQFITENTSTQEAPCNSLGQKNCCSGQTCWSVFQVMRKLCTGIAFLCKLRLK